jgi:phosphoribosylformylglycinamidine synthase
MTMKVRVTILPREAVLDPQGQAITTALHGLGFSEVERARQGKVIDLQVHADTKSAADHKVRAMCERLLANPVMEDFTIHVLDDEEGPQ